MSSKKIFAISLFLFSIFISGNVKAATQTCFTSEGLDATTNSDDNLYKYIVPIRKISVKVRSQISSIKNEENENEIEEVRLGRIINIGISERVKDSETSPLTSGYMLLTIVNEKN